MASQVTSFSQPYKSGCAGTSNWPRAAIFDFDGLLVDTARCWHQAYARVLWSSGRLLTRPKLEQLNGASVASAAELLSVPSGRLSAELEAAFGRAELTPLPGAVELVGRLRKRMPLAIATNGPEDLVSAALDEIGLRKAFLMIVSAESQRNEKPAPDVYLAACAGIDVHPSDAIAFEDSSVGAQAARAAGLTVCLVPSVRREHVAADLRIRSLADPDLEAMLRLGDTRP